MDLNYDLKTWEFQLQRMTLITIIQQIVDVARLNPFPTADASIIESRAKDRAKNLRLPLILKKSITNMIRPIMEEILAWYKDNGNSVRPVLTPQGTVYVAKSARDWMEYGNRSALSLFYMACSYCCEDEIFLYGQQVIHKQDRLLHSPLMIFWLQVYNGQFVKKITKKDLSEEQCDIGIKRALKSRKLFATKYFLEKASSDELAYLSFSYIFPKLVEINISPDMCAMIYPHALRHTCQSKIASEMLITLLKWPYQSLFLKAAETLSIQLGAINNFKIVQMITTKTILGYEDYDYKDLFTGFWNAEWYHETKTLMKTLDLFDIKLLYGVFLMLDKKIALMVFDDLDKEDKKLFIQFYKNNCATMIYAKNYQPILLFLDVYKAKEQQLYLDFKKYLEEMISISLFPKWSIFPSNYAFKDFEEKQWMDHFKEFKGLLSKWESAE